jgi:hypothetical protein
MELHPHNGVFPMPEPHDLALGSGGDDFQIIREALLFYNQ